MIGFRCCSIRKKFGRIFLLTIGIRKKKIVYERVYFALFVLCVRALDKCSDFDSLFCAPDVNRDREKTLSSQLRLPNERLR